MNLKVKICGMEFRNPIILASGPLSSTKEALIKAYRNGFGGIVTKSVTMSSSKGNPKPRWAFGSSYLVSADGLPNKGFKEMAENIKKTKELGITIPIIASIAGASPEEFKHMSIELVKNGADAIELNLVCPHRGALVGRIIDEPFGSYWAKTPERSFNVIKTVKDAVQVPVWAKFPACLVLANPEIILKMEEAGVDAVVPFPGIFPGMIIDIETGKPVLGNPEGSGTITGNAIKPAGIKYVSEFSRMLRIPVIGTGGISSGLDVIEYAMVGAHAVQILTAVMQKIKVSNLIEEIKKFILEKKYETFQSMVGKSLEFLPPRSR